MCKKVTKGLKNGYCKNKNILGDSCTTTVHIKTGLLAKTE